MFCVNLLKNGSRPHFMFSCVKTYKRAFYQKCQNPKKAYFCHFVTNTQTPIIGGGTILSKNDQKWTQKQKTRFETFCPKNLIRGIQKQPFFVFFGHFVEILSQLAKDQKWQKVKKPQKNTFSRWWVFFIFRWFYEKLEYLIY